jgi:tRNA dimethylallyltransferase
MLEDPTRVADAPGNGSAGPPDQLRPPSAGSPTVAWASDTAAPQSVAIGDDCWFLSGATASGKSSLAVRMARHLDAEIVSVDSMAVYRGLDIGTAKPTADQRALVPHHLVDVAWPSEAYSVARWLDDVAAALASCRSRGRRILFVGGTPLYLRALRDGLAVLPAADPEFRDSLAAEAAAHGSEHLHRRLSAIDPASAARIHRNDTRRIIRALEVAAATGRPLSAAFSAMPNPLFEERLLIVDVPRATLRERIDRRVERMFAHGLVEETRTALQREGGIGPIARQGAGYTEAIDAIEGRIDVAEAIRRTQDRTRQLAKRQLTWLRSFSRATWIAA